MRLMNTLDEFLAEKGVTSGYRFWKATGLTQSTAYRLYRDRDTYPDRDSVITICKTYDAQPGDFLKYVPQND